MAAQTETTAQIEALFDRLWPLPRSLTGEGVRATHDILSEYVPLQRIEVPSGTQVFDWTIPEEWNVRDAYLIAPDGRRIFDVADNNLRLVNYSVPFRGTLSRAALDAHLHSRRDMPDAIPYVTSYYQPRWGFCLSEIERHALPDGDYQVVVDTELSKGALTMSEAVLPGTEADEVLISSYTCHPSLANNELSGPLVAAFLYRRLAAWPQRRLTYRFVFAPKRSEPSLIWRCVVITCASAWWRATSSPARVWIRISPTSVRAAQTVSRIVPRYTRFSISTSNTRFAILRRLAATSGNTVRPVSICRWAP